jgi:ABC-type uncharacterized transport system ATPase subunit
MIMTIELDGIRKRFGQILANDGISLTVSQGSIHGILGENGAGKSTLMKILGGLLRADGGVIRSHGTRIIIDSPQTAMAHGIGMLFQEPMDFPALSVLENFMVGQPAALQREEHRKRFLSLADEAGFTLNPDDTMTALSVGERQQVEILRLMGLGVRLLILDEPTTGISLKQKSALFDALRRFAGTDRSVLLVSHKLEDVQALCDAVTVLRKGRVAGAMRRPFTTPELLRMMFASPPVPVETLRVNPGKPVVLLENASVAGGRTGLRDCSLEAFEGEIIGLAGLEGSGQSELLRAASGMTGLNRGRVVIDGNDLTGSSHRRFRREGVAFLPADRIQEGLIDGLTVLEHAALTCRDCGYVRPERRALPVAEEKIQKFQVDGRPGSLVGELSGGNQQRLMLSFLPPSPKLLLLENPTRGLDVESSAWIWRHLASFCRGGTCILFASSELDEIMTMASRILVFFEGKIILDAPAAATSAEDLGNAIAGLGPE